MPSLLDVDYVYDGATPDYDTSFAQYAVYLDMAKLKAYFVATFPGR